MRAILAVFTTILALALAGCGVGPAGSRAVDELPPPSVTVASVNGSGCPAGTATASADGSRVRVTYTAFTAKAGAGSTPTQFRRNCQLNLRIVSPGLTYAVTSVTEHGAVQLPAGGTVLQRTTYYLQGSSASIPVDHTGVGPLSGGWDKTDTAPSAAPCGTTRNLNINVELRVTSPGPAASLTLDGADAGTTVNLEWAPCP